MICTIVTIAMILEKGTFVPSVLDGKVEGDYSSRACARLAD